MATNDSASPGKSREAEPDPLINTVLGERYRVERRLSQGGMGVVYRARHVVLDSALAVKVLLKPQSAEDQRRFLQEAKLASLIQHPNTVQIIDFGVLPSGQSYLVMELLRGRTLASELRPGPLDALRVCRIGKQIAHGLQTVHDQGIVHRGQWMSSIFVEKQVLAWGGGKRAGKRSVRPGCHWNGWRLSAPGSQRNKGTQARFAGPLVG